MQKKETYKVLKRYTIGACLPANLRHIKNVDERIKIDNQSVQSYEGIKLNSNLGRIFISQYFVSFTKTWLYILKPILSSVSLDL